MLERFEQFSGTVSQIHRAIQKLEREEMERYGFRGAYAGYLVALRRHPEGLTAAALSEECDKDKGAVSRLLAEMAEKGLVTRAGAYNAPVTLTPAGKEAAAFVAARACDAVAAMDNRLSPEQRATMYEALEQILDALQTLTKEGIPQKEDTK